MSGAFAGEGLKSPRFRAKVAQQQRQRLSRHTPLRQEADLAAVSGAPEKAARTAAPLEAAHRFIGEYANTARGPRSKWPSAIADGRRARHEARHATDLASRGGAFRSDAVRLAVTVADGLAVAEREAGCGPSVQAARACMRLLDELVGAVDPAVAPLLARAAAVAERCIFSDEVDGSACGAAGVLRESSGAWETRLPFFEIAESLKQKSKLLERLEADRATLRAKLEHEYEAAESSERRYQAPCAGWPLPQPRIERRRLLPQALLAESVEVHRERMQAMQAMQTMQKTNEQLRAALVDAEGMNAKHETDVQRKVVRRFSDAAGEGRGPPADD
ncbi:hypothetical protein EMIHUDRAFT_227395 [Emiliania huxleyi CCMP1516]|uniref:Uncharacterized protein n=2 Tax=Emiliania huxleyi TaxID=2903 RepID=A0A0D3ICN1_EMIH1|nr:hypothetical protein EMIHUDRAFT_216825 [Emiliania huxleyi CCMP1516]XP_005788055.1 hypothetical protein EMIHUDRAFT_227395 [Emiliania huxleyi CCMP1516]EOD09016.1 hypothetical protein EMIHUDRAFT_216825 [Emiliania huxleyi CCMP1516]EOD35626.1 hypothetical protein EMIHUDRAFT_227395 [Emiliania huxleyi CCMP1516]|eukprot:XP_005761445.1 hypothetical protein EMIHUDRAFT_216825 [Emiliania huxleyi CCMP1516]